MTRQFKGTINLDIRDSKPDWPAFLADKAPKDAPNGGYEAYRTWVLRRMIAKGILPQGTELTPINPTPEGRFTPVDAVRPRDTLSVDEKKLFSRMAEVYAGFSEYIDSVGRHCTGPCGPSTSPRSSCRSSTASTASTAQDLHRSQWYYTYLSGFPKN